MYYSEKSIKALAKKYCKKYDGLSICWGEKGVMFDGFYFVVTASYDEATNLNDLFELCLARYLPLDKEWQDGCDSVLSN